jgi:anti-sigma regulatory factor (Ser/Thr protein kinase)
MKPTMSTQPTTSECSIDFPTSPSWFRTIRQLISSAATQCGFSSRDAGQIAMAVDEALSNVYRHGYHGSTDGRVYLEYKTSCTPSPLITIEITDDATQIDIELIRSRVLEDIKPGGLGVHLIQTVMDHSSWEKRPEGGMRLIMTKTSTNPINSTLQSNTDKNG